MNSPDKKSNKMILKTADFCELWSHQKTYHLSLNQSEVWYLDPELNSSVQLSLDVRLIGNIETKGGGRG